MVLKPPEAGAELARAWALIRYQVISAYLVDDPPRGQRGPYLAKLAARSWVDPDGVPFTVEAETVRSWVRRYHKGGLGALEDKQSPRRGRSSLPKEVIDLAVAIKEENPARTLKRIIKILEECKGVEPGLVRRSTLHRALRARGVSGRKARIPDSQDLDRFEAVRSNDLWQSDMLVGPWMPDPNRPGKVRRAYLYAFLDDHSRLCLAARFAFQGDLPSLELVMRRALQRYGLCQRVYYDNGKVYRSDHMGHIVATLGMHGRTFTEVHRPMGHGKIEAFNRLVRGGFLSEVPASHIKTLDELNEAFAAWVDEDYNRVEHSETGQAPLDRWHRDGGHVQYADDEKLRQAFLWEEVRSADKSGLFSLFGTQYQVGPDHAHRKVRVRYDPERLDTVEIWIDGKFVERLHPFQVQPERRPPRKELEADKPKEPCADYLGHLVDKRRKKGVLPKEPRDVTEACAAARQEADTAILQLIEEHMAEGAFDLDAGQRWLDRFGPLDPDRARETLAALADGPRDQHAHYYLHALSQAEKGQ